MLLKGIIPVADVVAVEDPKTEQNRFFSWVLEVEQLPGSMTIEDLEAEIVIVRFLFRDADRHFASGLHNVGSSTGIADKKELAEYYYYDFDQVYENFWDRNDSTYLPNKRELRSIAASPRFAKKVAALTKQLEGPEGLAFIAAVEEKMDKPATEWFKNPPAGDVDAKTVLQEVLLDRLRILQELAPAEDAFSDQAA